MTTPVCNDELDKLIWNALKNNSGHPTNNQSLIIKAGGNWRRINARMQAMRKAGRIRLHRKNQGVRPVHVRKHGWEVVGCHGEGYNEDGRWDWREGCSDCLRRTKPDPDAGTTEPPLIITFECELRIAP